MQALNLIKEAGWQQGWWVTADQQPVEGLPKGIHHLSAAASRKELGSEQACLVFDAFTGLSPDSLGALAGTLKAGGLLLLLTPENWSQFPDPDYRRLTPWPWQPEHLSRRFLQRCQGLLADLPGGYWREGEAAPAWADPDAWSLAADVADEAEAITLDWGAKTSDQEALITKLLAAWSLPSPPAQVITANRGRGKSSALGLAAAAWLEQHPDQTLVVTAPTALASQTLFSQFNARLEGRGVKGSRSGQLRFMAPDALLQEKPQANLVLVDEAAALPVPVLKQILDLWPASVFATTQAGYEGNGRGFALRFTRYLQDQAPGWQEHSLNQPIRWAADDPLEFTVNRLLMLDTRLPDPPEGEHPASIAWLDRDELATDEKLLREVFGLLVLAHYRTTPDDLRQLLDTPGVRLAIMRQEELPLALVWIQEEGGMDAELAQEIYLGRRRPQGHLLAQSLAFHAGQPQAAEVSWWRIQRILVHPRLQRQGRGQQLLQWVLEQAVSSGEQQPDLLGSSFGATPELLPFWQSAGFQAARLGITRDQASGEHTLQVVRGLTSRGKSLEADLSQRFAQTLPDQLQQPLKNLPADLAAELLRQPGYDAGVLLAADRRELKAFSEGHRPWAVTLTALKKWFLAVVSDPAREIPLADRRAWTGLLFLEWSRPQLVKALRLSGKKQLDAWLRASYQRLDSSQE
nr:GNAT family N-acetyltransferase [Marinospirillum perlucidum]